MARANRLAQGSRPMSVTHAVFVLGALSIFGPLSMDLYLPSLPELTRDLGTSDSLAQATMSVCMIGLGLGQLVAGPLSDRIGRRRPLIVGVALFAALSLACAFAPNIWLLLFFRFLQGLAGSAGMVVAMAMARDMYDGADLSRMLSLLALVKAAGPTLAPVLGGQLARFMDWRGVFLVLTGIGVALIVVALFGLRETLPHARRHTGGAAHTRAQFRALAHDRLFAGIVVVSALTSAVFFAYLSMSSFVFQGEFGLGPAQFSLIFAGNSIAMLIGAQLNGLVVRRTGPRFMYIASLTAEAIAAIVLLCSVLGGWGLVPMVGLLFLMMFTQGPSNPNKTTLALHDHGARAGTAASVLGTTTFMVGPIVVPLFSLGGATALTMVTMMCVLMVLAAIMLWVLVRPQLIKRGF